MEIGLAGQSGVVVTLISVLMAPSQEIGHVTTHPLRMVVKTVKGTVLISHHATMTAVQVNMLLYVLLIAVVETVALSCHYYIPQSNLTISSYMTSKTAHYSFFIKKVSFICERKENSDAIMECDPIITFHYFTILLIDLLLCSTLCKTY